MTALTVEEEQKRIEAILSQDSGLAMVYPAPAQRNSSNRVVVVPGAYNPIHAGHKELMYRAATHINAGEAMAVLQHSSGISMQQRLEMLRMEQSRIPYLSIAIGSADFTSLVSQLIQDTDRQYTCAVGAEILEQIFGNFDILSSIDWLVADRANARLDLDAFSTQAPEYAGRVKPLVLDSSLRDISSQGIRELLNAREPIALKYVAEDQLGFIQRQDIYF